MYLKTIVWSAKVMATFKHFDFIQNKQGYSITPRCRPYILLTPNEAISCGWMNACVCLGTDKCVTINKGDCSGGIYFANALYPTLKCAFCYKIYSSLG